MKKILVVDGVNNETEEFETVNEAKSWIKECFIDKDEGIHPDIESVKIYEQKYITDVVEAEDGYKVTFNEIESVPAETLVMPKPTHWLELKLTEMLVELESRVDRQYSGSWIVNDEALQEYKDGISYIKQLLSA